jgi:hypothetical protein
MPRKISEKRSALASIRARKIILRRAHRIMIDVLGYKGDDHHLIMGVNNREVFLCQERLSWALAKAARDIEDERYIKRNRVSTR